MNDSNAAAMRAGATASNHFAFDLQARVGTEPGNTFFSPTSLSLALAMTALGARGETLAQMERVLRLDTLQGTSSQRAYAALNGQVNTLGRSGSVELRSANRLWGQRGHEFLPSFQETARLRYGAALEEVDFAGDAEAARQHINRWVSEQTREKIRELLAKGTVDGLTRLVLTNAIYFRGAWQDPFEPRLTRDGQPFHVSAGRTAKVSMMRQTDWFRHTEDEQAQWLELPYKGGETAMLIALPKQVDGLASLEASLDAKRLATRVSQLDGGKVAVSLPKFKLSAALQLKDVLSSMGMPLAFEPSRADFSGMTAREPLNLSAVVHQAEVDVNEVGTEAAAATAIGAAAGAARPRIVEFNADHPFLFYILDTWSGAVLFQGKLVDPGA
ncbi:serpin family protein [Pyxidicoccus parkwayensis]|uniref:Serpin family protein n=1 Tax=Pyxidicoccus parkwayensis TaxID=2813578 RepID=A0ABX7NWX0_9BACT|nr:serpin family protein [Pyxidicoccus parkwaysis]QSQ21970.1 serpin family protein [Pyxidicoccus parkwaysis]